MEDVVLRLRALQRPQHYKDRIAPTWTTDPAFYFGQIFVAVMRKTDNRADEQEEHGELGVHFSTS
jgi:hypothetical protein